MNSIEELRYLILAAQREGDRLLSASLEPIGFRQFSPKNLPSF